MAFQEIDTVLGAEVSYRLAPTAKRYTLRDNGFTETKGGNFQLIRPLEATPQSKEGFKLKITVDKDIQKIKMSVTTANGLKAVNIFKDSANDLLQEKFYFLMDGFISRGLFEKV
ncbi:hypothetical protein DOK78_003135 [Enterococcus sp. DIV2402]|jgi:hypothetical protein|uniref:Cysteine desulfurase n=1 Tax=Candidatus Enterococcus lowellii TaxID=2230877 RepID=A0ABZ2SRU3_9ENTE|nr:DUF1831 domain-containing protein [Enterococcus sp. DIV2402]MBO0463012.1 DUF1831 domain-containing protein [Enterococcus sp. DIV2402]HPR81940.1 DUF1831 domain-containing protein [Enterococcus sp.]